MLYICIIATLMKTNEESRVPANEKPGSSDQLSSRSVLQFCTDTTIWFKLNCLASFWSLPFQCSLSSSRSIFTAVPSFVCSVRTVTNQAAALCFKLCQHMTFWAFWGPSEQHKSSLKFPLLNCIFLLPSCNSFSGTVESSFCLKGATPQVTVILYLEQTGG